MNFQIFWQFFSKSYMHYFNIYTVKCEPDFRWRTVRLLLWILVYFFCIHYCNMKHAFCALFKGHAWENWLHVRVFAWSVVCLVSALFKGHACENWLHVLVFGWSVVCLASALFKGHACENWLHVRVFGWSVVCFTYEWYN